VPDWVGHILFALILCEIGRVKKGEMRALVVLGALLPDIVSKAHLLGFFLPFNAEQMFLFFHPTAHSLLGAFLLALIASGLFVYDQKKAFLLLSIGSVSHILADMTNRFFVYGPIHAWLPFSFQSTFVGLFWSDEYLYQILIFLILYMAILGIKGWKR